MNLSTTIDFDFRQFFLWWGRELAYWVPEKYRQVLSDKTGYVFLSITEESVQFSQSKDGTKENIAELTLDDSSQQKYQKLTNQHEGLEQARFILRLNSDQAIKKMIYLPLAAKENLRQVVAFEMDRYTPFKVEQVYYSVKIVDKEDNGQLKVLLVYTAKDILDKLCQQLKSIQIYPVVADYEKAANNLDEDLNPYNLLPEGERPVKNRMTRFSIGFLSFALLLLLSAVLIFPVWYESQVVDSLRQQLQELEQDTRLVQSQQLEIDQIMDETERLIQTKKKAPSVTELTNALSLLLSDDTWLTHLKFNNSRLQIQGQSIAASALIGALEGSDLFSNARFVSPLTQDKRTGMERFQISVEVNVQEEVNE